MRFLMRLGRKGIVGRLKALRCSRFFANEAVRSPSMLVRCARLGGEGDVSKPVLADAAVKRAATKSVAAFIIGIFSLVDALVVRL